MSAVKRRFVWLHPKLDKPMGGANFVLFAAHQLRRHADIVVIAQQTSAAMRERFAEMGVPLISLDSPTFTDKKFWLLHEQCLRRNVEQVEGVLRDGDVVISSMYPMNVVAHRLDRHDIQVIYEPFSFFHDKMFVRGFGPVVAAFFAFMRKIHVQEDVAATRAAGRILTLSGLVADSIRHVYQADSTVIFEGVDMGMFHPGVEPHGDFADRRIIFHSTGFDRYKGTDLVIAAMPDIVRQTPDVLLVVTYTRVDQASLRRYREDLEHAGIAGNVRFLGTVPYTDLPGLNKAARLYVEPGWDRPMSLSVKEAMACGTPVVRGSAGWEEIDDGKEGFLVAPDDRDSYIDRVVRLLTDDALHNRMSRDAVQRIRRQFTWEAVSDRIAEHAGLISNELREAV